jgi:hypothetical protein
MTRNDDFDRTLESWLRRQAPPQAPDRVLEAALQRAESEPQRRGWLHRLAGGTPMTMMIRVAAVAAVLAIAAFIGYQFSNFPDNIGASPTPIPLPSAEPSASSPPSAAPESAEPSTEPSAEPSAAALMLQLMGPGEAGNVHQVTILDDGRVITSDPSGAKPPTERVLTAEGIQLVRDELDATGLTDESASYTPVPNPGREDDAPGYGGAPPVLRIGQTGGDEIVISWYLFNDSPEQDWFQPQPEAEALEALAARLTTLVEWLPASAWSDATGHPYEPESYLMIIDDQPQVPGESDWVDVATVAWPLDEAIDEFGELSDPPIDNVRSGCLSGADGLAVIQALDAAGAGLGGDDLRRDFVLSDGDLQISITVTVNLVANPNC